MQRLEFVVNDEENKELTDYNKQKLAQLIEMLLKNEYEIRLLYDDYCVIIECSLKPNVYGGAHLEWIEDEQEL